MFRYTAFARLCGSQATPTTTVATAQTRRAALAARRRATFAAILGSVSEWCTSGKFTYLRLALWCANLLI